MLLRTVKSPPDVEDFVWYCPEESAHFGTEGSDMSWLMLCLK